MLFLTLLLHFLILFKLNSSQNDDKCESKLTCAECIQELTCFWCIQPLNSSGEMKLHCGNSNLKSQCPSDYIKEPELKYEIVEDKPLKSSDENVVQIRPQKVKLKLRKGQEHILQFQYQQAKNYPVDLYYLMDLSISMKEYKDILAKLGAKLASTMTNLTSNLSLGFGSFIDKVEVPFVSMIGKEIADVCRDKENCVPPYGFKNHMRLSNDANSSQDFSNKVNKAATSTNMDTPEGGFDAIMQAIVCKEVIGWRKNARHLLVLSSDAIFHVAGDGKLAGIIEPNDGKCHMKDDIYTDSLVYDYPSVSHINYIGKENNIYFIFAIVKNEKQKHVFKSYELLTDEIENSNIGELDTNPENVIKLVVDNYEKIVGSVSMEINAPKNVNIKLSSTCPNKTSNGCSNIHMGDTINFTATVKLLECSPENSNTTIISIKPVGLQESIIIELESLCSCDCESSDSEHYESNATQCTSFGDLTCGICKCSEGRFGRNCECDDQNSKSKDIDYCIQKGTTKQCSDAGTCKCGMCVCDKRQNPYEKYSGTYCECNNFLCIDNGVVCSEHGECNCQSECNCHDGWTGKLCECPKSDDLCISRGSNLVCNGHGTCKCGKCECNVDQNRYYGEYCEECSTCSAQRCKDFQDCVECQVHKMGVYKNKNECEINCKNLTIHIVDNTIESTNDTNIKMCRVPDGRDCTYVFSYQYDNNKYIVNAEKKKICNEPVNIWVWILGVIGTVLIAGLITLIIWKVCTTIHDRKEYAKFVDEKQKLNWHTNQNPLYKGAISEFNNPVYNRGSRRFSFKQRKSDE